MSCYIAPLQGGSPQLFPIPHASFQEFADTARAAMAAAMERAGEATHYIGATCKPDGTPFYLSTVAPAPTHDLAEGWTGAFFAPFGFGSVHGTVTATPGDRRVMRVSVEARLMVEDKEHAAAKWTVYGSQLTTANKAVIMEAIEITNPGPHSPEDIRRCIALHAPQSLGEPRAIVAMQCGVAVACLVEAIC